MKFNLILFEGSDIIKFGMKREELQAILQVKPKLFKKTEFDLFDTEDYSEICHVFYEVGENNTPVCAAIEFFKPSLLYLDGNQLIGVNKDKVEALFQSKFDDCVSDGSGISSTKYDIAFFAPKKTVASVYIARKGYSEEQDAYLKKAFDEKYNTAEEDDDPSMQTFMCPNCLKFIKARECIKCPDCNVDMI